MKQPLVNCGALLVMSQMIFMDQ